MTLEKEVLAELKEKLEKEKIQLENELSRIADQTQAKGDYETRFNEIGTGEDENATEVEEYTDNLALEENLQKQLAEVEEALSKIQLGTYGFCENCQKMIPLDRLRAYPAAKKCLDCKN